MMQRRVITATFLLVFLAIGYINHRLGRYIPREEQDRHLIAGVEANYAGSAEFRRLNK